ncbi:MAG TPA: hypothetical protein VMV46_01275 [Thermoanaerobaculia bacterium]|nr:hypothetical protein [Thermoanaerobaculia bacterium]
MQAWWGTLDTALKVFYATGLAAGVVLLIQMALMLFGLDGDGDADVGEHGETGVLSVRTITAFFAGFGWTGVAMIEGGSSVAVATFAGLVVGSGFVGAVLLLMRLIYGMRAQGNLDYRNAIGVVGKVYTPIAANLERAGQVEVMVQGRLRTVQAMTRAERPLATNTRVRVVELIDETTLLVEPV